MLEEKIIHNYNIIRLLGRGGMGEVYLAKQNDLERLVALKIIYKTMQIDFIQRFKREAKIAAALQHPHIVNIYNIGEENDFFYIAMEYVEGQDMQQILKDGALPEAEVWREIVLPVCSALLVAANKNIIHRDIKPANLLFNINGHVKLTDFGLSKIIADGNGITSEGTVLGTPEYMSPEQATHNDIDFRSDIYSLGATIYHLLTNRKVFAGKHFVDVLLKHKSEPVIPPQEYATHLKMATSRILGKMLAKLPEDRYQRYEDIIIDVEALLQNKPLIIAKETKILSIYAYNPEKKKTTTERLKTWLMSSKQSEIDSSTTSRIIKGTITSRIILSMKEKPKNAKKEGTESEKIEISSEAKNSTLKIKTEQQNGVSSQEFSSYILDFYQDVKSTLLKPSTTGILIAFNMESPSIYQILEGDSEVKCIRKILQNAHELGKSLEAIFSKDIFMHETFNDNYYQALLWSNSQSVAFIYADVFSNISKMSLCHTNIFGIYKNIENKIPV
ncbi:serine/threonine-protein kinase [Candidatus Uabimicrobium sp. HlEnr_7]|uniref:serine/threonine-protein kinase n=1 Tax=Candidatus Uabimicrobium helgolandensis TaxID=3095367 RepID=UPI0035592DE9